MPVGCGSFRTGFSSFDDVCACDCDKLIQINPIHMLQTIFLSLVPVIQLVFNAQKTASNLRYKMLNIYLAGAQQ
jgi:hypothetical protein